MSNPKALPVEKHTAPDEFTRSLTWRPAFDKRDPDPSKDYGVHGMEARWVLKGPKGAVQFLLYTGWQLPQVAVEFERRGCGQYCPNKPMAADIGYHSPSQRYDGQPMNAECDILGGGPCYYDGSSLNAKGVFAKFVAGGEDALWAEMREWYDRWFAQAEGTQP